MDDSISFMQVFCAFSALLWFLAIFLIDAHFVLVKMLALKTNLGEFAPCLWISFQGAKADEKSTYQNEKEAGSHQSLRSYSK